MCALEGSVQGSGDENDHTDVGIGAPQKQALIELMKYISTYLSYFRSLRWSENQRILGGGGATVGLNRFEDLHFVIFSAFSFE